MMSRCFLAVLSVAILLVADGNKTDPTEPSPTGDPTTILSTTTANSTTPRSLSKATPMPDHFYIAMGVTLVLSVAATVLISCLCKPKDPQIQLIPYGPINPPVVIIKPTSDRQGSNREGSNRQGSNRTASNKVLNTSQKSEK